MIYLFSLIPLLLIYPYIISKGIIKKTKIIKNKDNKKIIIKNIIKLILLTIITLFIMINILNLYMNTFPESTSKLCTNTGGFTYSCIGDTQNAPIYLLIIGIIIIIHHFISIKFIYKIFEYNSGLFRYVFMYIHIGIIYLFNFILLFYLYGLFISVHFDFILIELLRLIVFLLPSGLFLISTFINKKELSK